MPSIKDLTGQSFGKLTVIKIGKTDGHGAYWHCVCECGTKKEVRGNNLRSGKISSCGCFRRAVSSQRLSAMNTTNAVKTRAKKAQPVENSELLREIEKSKLSYCYFLEPEHARYDARVQDSKEITADLLAQIGKSEPVIRLYTYDHIPSDDRKSRPRERGHGFSKTNFPPFKHVVARLEGGSVVLHEVGRSHWTGGLGNGYFSTEHGRMTERLGVLLWEMTIRYARRPNWNGYTYKDEMISNALLQLMSSGLEFDESKTDNPFAFYTTCIYYCFLKVLAKEQQSAEIRDQMLTDAGMQASQGWQDREYLKKFEPVKLKRKVGRPAKARSGVVVSNEPKRKPGRPPTRLEGIVGQTFGQRTIIEDLGHQPGANRYVMARCTCGKEDRVKYHTLQRGEGLACRACSHIK